MNSKETAIEKILKLLSTAPYSSHEIADKLKMPIGTVRSSLSLLRRLGLVKPTEGKRGQPFAIVWRSPTFTPFLSVFFLEKEYSVDLGKEVESMAETLPKDSLENLYKKCEETRHKLNVQDRNFSIKLFLAVMFNVLRLYWVTKTE